MNHCVDAGNTDSSIQQLTGNMGADPAGRAGHQYFQQYSSIRVR
jgi:hypothetical protein